jgi:hypothetical protein
LRKNHGDCTPKQPVVLLLMLLKVNHFVNPTLITSFPYVETFTTYLKDFLFYGPSCLIEFLEKLLAIELLIFHRHYIITKNVHVLCYGGRHIVKGGLMWHG